MLQDLKNLIPEIQVYYEGLESAGRPKPKMHPIEKVQRHIIKNKLQLIDFFREFDADGSMKISHKEFRVGLSVPPSPLHTRTQVTVTLFRYLSRAVETWATPRGGRDPNSDERSGPGW